MKLIILLLLLLPISSYSQTCKRTVELKEFTDLTIDIVPHLGTRLVFPFIINDTNEIIPFSSSLTNSAIFHQTRPKNTDHNSILYTVKSEEWKRTGGQKVLGNAYISIAGYNITARLQTTTNLKKHCDDIVFNLSDEKRDYLVDYAVQNRIEQYKKNYQDRLKQVDTIATNRSRSELGRLALLKPKYRNIKEEMINNFETGGSVIVYLDRFHDYEHVDILVMEIENKSGGAISIDQLNISAVLDDNSDSGYDSDFYCSKTINRDAVARCAIIFNDNTVYKQDRLRISVSTDRGILGYEW